MGTRESALALWQTHHVQDLITDFGYRTEVIKIKTEGDLVLDTPLHMMGGKGVFTKALDNALLQNDIDIAVHSLKDIPTVLPKGLAMAAILEREDARDCIVTRKGLDFLEKDGYEAVIASSSPRRISQWFQRYPNHSNVDIRGNVQTRLKKLRNSDWDATIFAAAGLKRLKMEDEIDQHLDWMVSAPGQGAVAILIREEDLVNADILEQLHHDETALCVTIERDFLNRLNGGCSAPVGALATIENDTVHFKGVILSMDGKKCIRIEKTATIHQAKRLGIEAANEALEQGAAPLVEEVRK